MSPPLFPSAGAMSAAIYGTKHKASFAERKVAPVFVPPILHDRADEFTKLSPMMNKLNPPGSRPLARDMLCTEASAW